MIGVVAVLLAAGLVVAIMLDTHSDPPRATENSGRVVGAVTVQRRDLVQTDTESGTLSYADPQTVYNRLSGTITWLPKVGQLIKRGQALFDVNEKPVILLYGSTPAYRDLGFSDGSGADIREVNANLVSLGYSDYGVVVDDTWQSATTNAVKALQRSLGEEQTGKLTLGQVVFLPGEQLVNTVGGTVGSPAGPGSGGAAILQTSSTRLVVTVDLAASSQSEAVVGSRVTVEMPDGSTVGGKITAVSSVANSSGADDSSSAGGSSSESANGSSGSGSGSSATVPVTITLDRRVKGAGLDQAPVSVNFAQAKAKHVLSVPVTALVATSGASYAVQEASGANFAVQEAAAPHKLIPVSTGLFAAGYVQVSGPGIHAGLKVTDSQG